VADLIRGMEAEKALHQLRFLPKKSAGAFSKLLNSGIASAEHNFNLLRNNLFISDVFVDGGPTMKRWRPRAFGRAFNIMKRTSHITLVLDEKVKDKKKRLKKSEIPKKEAPSEEKRERKEKPKFKADMKSHKDVIREVRPKSDSVFKKIFRRKSV
jgi:large subunit ribosomal protein L22